MDLLHRDELCYEASIRGFKCPEGKLTEDLREWIKDRLDIEDFELSSLNAVKELQTCQLKANKLLEYTNNTTDISSVTQIIKARLRHLYGRVARLTLDDPSLRMSRDAISDTLQTIETSVQIRQGVTPDDSIRIRSPNRATRSVPVYKWNLTFNGSHSVSVGEFLELIEERRVSRNVSTDELFQSAADLFEGKARTWYRSIKHKVTSWDELVYQLKLNFVPADYDECLWDEIRTRTQGLNENVGEYFACMLNLFSRLSVTPAENVKLRLLRKNLSPYFTKQLALLDFETEDELLDCCRKIENARYAANKYVPPRGSTENGILEPDLACKSTSPANKSIPFRNKARIHEVKETQTTPSSSNLPINCWNCSVTGHRFRNCPNPRKRFCYACGNGDHIATSCPKNATGPV